MYGQHHSLTKRPDFSKVVWNLTFPQIAAILIGGKLSWEFAKIVPALPFKNPIFAHVHKLIPLGLTLALLYIREQKTGLLLYQYLFLWVKYKLRQDKTFVWKRST